MNRYSTFPDALDELKKLSEVQEMTLEQKQKVSRYTLLATKSNLTGIEEVELQDLIRDLRGFQLNSSDWNRVVETLMNTQRYIKETILTNIEGQLVDFETNVTNRITSFEGNSMVRLEKRTDELIEQQQLGTEYFKNRVVVDTEANRILIGIPEYSRFNDLLLVYVNGAMVTEGINYVISVDNMAITSVNGNWSVGDVVIFLVLKKTLMKLNYYDTGLFTDGSIGKEKLNINLQNEVSKVNEVEGRLTEFKTLTNTALGQTNTALGQTNANLDAFIKQKGANNGLATLNSLGKIPLSQLNIEKDYVVGTYTGNNLSSRTISLGFRPKAVLLFPKWSYPTEVPYSTVFAVDDYPSQVTGGATLLSIGSNGFTVANGSAGSGLAVTNASTVDYNPYRYIAFK